MKIEDLLSPECTLAAIPGDSKKRVLELIARTLHQAHPILDEEEIFDRLIERERLGSTGIGDGVAIPHCRLANCCDTVGVLLQLNEAINFDAIDRSLRRRILKHCKLLPKASASLTIGNVYVRLLMITSYLKQRLNQSNPTGSGRHPNYETRDYQRAQRLRKEYRATCT